MKQTQTNPTKYIHPLNINGLSGRMLDIPPAKSVKKRTIILVYDAGKTLEEVVSYAQQLSRGGRVVVPDLPGCGGMDSLLRVGRSPSLDNLAAYLAAFTRLYSKHSKITFVGQGYGFVIITKMLQNYKALHRQVNVVISVEGFTYWQDLKINSRTRLLKLYGARCLSVITKAFPVVVRRRFSNDIHTKLQILIDTLSLDLTFDRLDLEARHIFSHRGTYLHKYLTEQHLGVVYKKVHLHPTKYIARFPDSLLNKLHS